ncbi:MAG: ATP-binding cassette domain-containing protein [Oscillospiraceae bacterium]
MTDIVCENICKRFDDKVVLNNFSAVFKANEIYAIMGKSGSGKTTLINILSGLLRKDSGVITGTENKKIAVMFQENRLLEQLSGLANLRLVCGKAIDYIQKGKEVSLTAEDMEKPVSELSGGQKRRIALLRAMLYDADIVLLDEPFKGLDNATRDMAAAFCLGHRANRTILFVTHDEKDVNILKSQKYSIDAL